MNASREFVKAEKIAISIRRIEYGKKLSTKKIKINSAVIQRIIFIQQWWRTIFSIITIQKIFRGFLLRLYMSNGRSILHYIFNKWKMIRVGFSDETMLIIHKLIQKKSPNMLKYKSRFRFVNKTQIESSILKSKDKKKKAKLGNYLTLSYNLNKWYNKIMIVKRVSKGLILLLLKCIIDNRHSQESSNEINNSKRIKFDCHKKKFTLKQIEESKSPIKDFKILPALVNSKIIYKNKRYTNEISEENQSNDDCCNIIDALELENNQVNLSVFRKEGNALRKCFTFSQNYNKDYLSKAFSFWYTAVTKEKVISLLKLFKRNYKCIQINKKKVLKRKEDSIKDNLKYIYFLKWKQYITRRLLITKIHNSLSSHKILVKGIISNLKLGQVMHRIEQVNYNNNTIEIKSNQREKIMKLFTKINCINMEKLFITYSKWKENSKVKNNYFKTKKFKSAKRQLSIKQDLSFLLIKKITQDGKINLLLLHSIFTKWIKLTSFQIKNQIAVNIDVSKGNSQIIKQDFNRFHSLIYTPIILSHLLKFKSTLISVKPILHKIIYKRDNLLTLEQYFFKLKGKIIYKRYYLHNFAKLFIQYTKQKFKSKLLILKFFSKAKIYHNQLVNLSKCISLLHKYYLQKSFRKWKQIKQRKIKGFHRISNIRLQKSIKRLNTLSCERLLHSEDTSNTKRSSYCPKRHISESLDMNSEHTLRESLHLSSTPLTDRRQVSYMKLLRTSQRLSKIKKCPTISMDLSQNENCKINEEEYNVVPLKREHSQLTRLFKRNINKKFIYELINISKRINTHSNICYLIKVSMSIRNQNNLNRVLNLIKQWKNLLLILQIENTTFDLLHKIYINKLSK